MDENLRYTLQYRETISSQWHVILNTNDIEEAKQAKQNFKANSISDLILVDTVNWEIVGI